MKKNLLTLICVMILIIATAVPVVGAGVMSNLKGNEYNQKQAFQSSYGASGLQEGWELQWSHAYGGDGHAELAQPIGDIDNDGINEVIMGGYENSGICRIMYYDATQETYLDEYSWFVPGGTYHSPSGACVVDLDEDGDLEFCVSWAYSGADGVYAYTWDDTTLTTLDWYHGTGVDFVYDVYTCDYDDDTHPEVLIANDPNPGGIHVSALGWDTGTDKFVFETSWTCPSGSGYSVPMVWSGDVDNDGKTEVIADVSDLDYATAGTWALNWDATTEEWTGVPVCTNYPGDVTVFGDGVGDVDGDGTPEIGVGSYGGTPGGWLFEWDGSKFVQVWHGEYPGQDPVIESVAVGDADNDRQIEFCFGTGNVHVIGWDGTGYYDKATLTGPTNMLAGLNIGDCDTDGYNEVKGCEILGGTGSEFIWQFIDTTPPITNYSLEGVIEGNVFISNVTVTLNATDTSTGVNSTQYSLDGGAWTLYTEPFVVSANGKHTVLFYSTDNVGNIEAEQSCTFTIQKESSQLTITIKGGVGVAASIKNSGTTTLTNISCTITLDGKLIFVGKTKTDLIASLAPGKSITVKDFVVGFGKTGITATAGAFTANATGSVFLFFVFRVS
jgi:hypothetical protein